jgi:hypothetical protein
VKREEGRRERIRRKKEDDLLITINNPHISPNTPQPRWPITQYLRTNNIPQNNLGFLKW